MVGGLGHSLEIWNGPKVIEKGQQAMGNINRVIDVMDHPIPAAKQSSGPRVFLLLAKQIISQFFFKTTQGRERERERQPNALNLVRRVFVPFHVRPAAPGSGGTRCTCRTGSGGTAQRRTAPRETENRYEKRKGVCEREGGGVCCFIARENLCLIRTSIESDLFLHPGKP